MTHPTNDPTLDAIAAWCDANGWDNLGSPAMAAWAKEAGIDLSQVTIHRCGVRCDHAWDGPIVEFDEGRSLSVTCSKCGRTALHVDMAEGR